VLTYSVGSHHETEHRSSGSIKWVEYGITGRVVVKIAPKRAKYAKKLLPGKDLAIIMASSVNELMATTAFARI
jgi:hypothetical protein